MAGKEATIYIVDVGATTEERHNGRVESDLEYGMRYVWDKIAETMSANRTTLTVGVVGLRTDETSNLQYDNADDDDKESYEYISVFKEMGPMKMSDLKPLQQKITPSTTSDGDAVSAIVVAIELMEKHTALKSGLPGKYKRKIVLLTDGQGSISDDDIVPIADRINEFNIELVVMYVLAIICFILLIVLVVLISMILSLGLRRKIRTRTKFVTSPQSRIQTHNIRQGTKNFSEN